MMSAVAPAPSSPPDKAPTLARGGKSRSGSSGSNNKSNNNTSNNASSQDDKDDSSNSLTSTLNQLSLTTITITLYIPSAAVGAVIGRRGQTIAQLQKTATLASTNSKIPVRISVREPETATYTPLDWSDANWTPVVIKADPAAAWSAAHQIHDLTVSIQDAIVDIPLHRHKHAAVVGKRGWTVAALSADHKVRIMVPNKDLRHDMIQLEGTLKSTEACFQAMLQVLVAPATIVVPQLPSHTKLRQVGRKTDTVIRKRKLDENSWQLTVTGTGQIQAALALLQKWKDDLNNKTPRKGRSANGNNSTPRGNSKRKSSPRDANNNKDSKPE